MDELTKTNIKAVVSDGYIVMYKNVSICDLNDHVDYLAKYKNNSKYQVHSDNQKFKCSEIYYNIDEAANRFLEVQKVVK
jgi:hypothetical protein